MTKKYFVTGGSGFIGSAIVKKLVGQGHKVLVLDNNVRGNKEKLKGVLDDIEFIEGDIRSTECLKKTESCDAIIHLAYINGTKYFYQIPYDILEIAVKGMVNVLDAIKKYDIPQLILASSSEAYQTPLLIPTPEEVPLIVPDIKNPRYSYGGGKIACELLAVNYAHQYNLDIRIFRPHNVYGPNMGYEHVIPEVCKKIFDLKNDSDNKIKIQGSGNETRAFVYIDDFTNGVDCILRNGSQGEIYNIGTDNEISIHDLYMKILGISGKRAILESEASPIGSTKRRCPDISKLKKLGYNQITSLDQGLNLTYNWYFDNFKN
jgi:nucleoside-diphosphate-sugar epimerase